MKKINKNKNGFTLVELLAVIVVLAIVMGLAVIGITSVLDSTRKSAFAADARSFIDGANSLVRADEAIVLMNGTSKYTPKCPADGSAEIKIPINDIKLDSGGKSPYGSDYDKKANEEDKDYSYVQVSATKNSEGICVYTYSIYLTDTVYKIGTFNSPISRDKISGECVGTDGNACQGT